MHLAELKKIVYRDLDERLMVGVHYQTSFEEAGTAWESFSESDEAKRVQELSVFAGCEDMEDHDGIGMMFHFRDNHAFEMVIGDFVKSDTPVPRELYQKRIPKGTVACVQIEGSDIAEIVESAFGLITESIERTGREIDFDQFYWCEIYTKERYSLPISRGEKVTIDYMLPVK